MSLIIGKSIFTKKTQDVIAVTLFIITAIVLFHNSHYGIGNEDQSFYLGGALRLTMGDSLLADDWSMTQLSSFLLYLPVKIYLTVFQSTDGIVLCFRYAFIAMQGIVSGFIYALFRKHGFISIFAALIFFSYVPVTIMAISYYSMGLVFVELTGLIMLTTKKLSKARFFVAGVFFACAVLCNPVLAFAYLLFCISMFIYEVSKAKGRPLFSFSEITFSFKAWLWVTLGIFMIATMFFLFLLSRTNLKDLLDNLPYIFKDPAYIFSGDGQNVIDFKFSLHSVANFSRHLVVVYGVLMIVLALDKNRLKHRTIYLATALFIFFLLIQHILKASVVLSISNIYGNDTCGRLFTVHDEIATLALMFPLTLLGFTCYVLSENKNKKMFVFLWSFGVLYAVCLDITSDFAPWNSMLGFAVSNTASIFFIKNIIDELRAQKKSDNLKNPYKKAERNKIRTVTELTSFILASTLVVQVFANLYVVSDFKSTNLAEYLNRTSIEKMSQTISSGPLKGLKTTNSIENAYQDMLRDLSIIKERNDGHVLIIPNREWGYVYLNMPYASFSVNVSDWGFPGQSRLFEYYRLHPDKTPRYIYIDKLSYWTYLPTSDEALESLVDNISRKYTCTVQESAVSYIIEILI